MWSLGKKLKKGQAWGPPAIQVSPDLWLLAVSTKAWQEKFHARKNGGSVRGPRVQMACQQFLNSARFFSRVGCRTRAQAVFLAEKKDSVNATCKEMSEQNHGKDSRWRRPRTSLAG